MDNKITLEEVYQRFAIALGKSWIELTETEKQLAFLDWSLNGYPAEEMEGVTFLVGSHNVIEFVERGPEEKE